MHTHRDGEPRRTTMTPTDRGRYELVDGETANAVGFYDSLAAALRDVAETVERYGAGSPEALSLVLIRLDVPADQGRVAGGGALVERALVATTGAADAAP